MKAYPMRHDMEIQDKMIDVLNIVYRLFFCPYVFIHMVARKKQKCFSFNTNMLKL